MGWIEALLVAIGGLLGVAGNWVIQYLKTRHQIQQETARTTWDESQVIIERLERHIGRVDHQMDDQQRAITALHEAEMECQLELAEFYGCMQRIHDTTVRQNDILQRLGHCPEVIPPLPARRVRRAPDPGFLRRTTEQSTLLVKEADKPAPTNSGGSPV